MMPAIANLLGQLPFWRDIVVRRVRLETTLTGTTFLCSRPTGALAPTSTCPSFR